MKKLLGSSAIVLTLAISPLASTAVLAHDEETKMMQSSPDAANAPYDIQFLDTMAEHHREGIEMFKIGAEKAQSQELRAKAQKMVNDQQKEVPELKTMRDNIQADAPEAINMDLPGMTPMDMGKLETASGKDFDHKFLNMTIKHHQGAVDMSGAALKRAKSQQVKDQAQKIIDKQSKEVAEMKQMHDAMK
jgi:uncharacterized protein (DUF305 family)